MPKQNKGKVSGKNLISERLWALREGRPVEGVVSGRPQERLLQKDLAERVAGLIPTIVPENSPVLDRARRHERRGAGDTPVFSRSDLTKIERGSRYVRDYELVALARALNVSVAELLGTEAHNDETGESSL